MKTRIYRVANLRSRWLAMLCLLIVGCATAPPPVQEMSDARQAIAAAREANAHRLAPQVYNRSVKLLSLAESTLSERRYRLAADQAMLARKLAIQAMDEAALQSRRARD